MPADISHKAPLTLKLIVSVNDYLRREGKTRTWLRGELNKLLPHKRQIEDTHAGIVKLNRWLDPTGRYWPEPRAEIALAMREFLDRNGKKVKKSVDNT